MTNIYLTDSNEDAIVDFVKDHEELYNKTNEHFKDKARKECPWKRFANNHKLSTVIPPAQQSQVATKGQQQQTRGQPTSFLVFDNQQAGPSRSLIFTLIPMKHFNPPSIASVTGKESEHNISGLSRFFRNLQSVMRYQQIDTRQPFSPADMPALAAYNHHPLTAKTSAATRSASTSASSAVSTPNSSHVEPLPLPPIGLFHDHS